MTESLEDSKLPYAERIAKLLRKAEATDSEHEAEALTQKAQQLMVTYAITEELLAKAQGKQVQDQIVEETIVYTGVFSRALYMIGAAIGRNNDCRVLISKTSKDTTLWLVGFSSDVDRVRMLDASIQIQASTALQRWWRAQDSSWMSAMDKFKARREFLFGFANGVGGKLRDAKMSGIQDAVKAEAERTGDVAAAKTSTELVLRTRTEQVNDWYDKTYGRSTRTTRMNYSSGGLGARSAGHAAGRSANIGQTGIGNTRGQIGGR